MALAAAVCMLLAGCFKKVSNDTQFIIKPNLLETSGAQPVIAEGAVAYAWFDRSAEWSIASYEDALNRVLTLGGKNKNDKEDDDQTDADVVTEVVEPDAQSVTLSDEGRAGWLLLDTESASVLLLVVYPEAQMYAWRVYATAENLSPTYMTVRFCPWKTGEYTDSGWTIGGIFPEPEPEPEPEPDPEDPDNPDDTEPDNPDNPDEPDDSDNPDDGGEIIN